MSTRELAARLYQRRHQALQVERRSVSIGEWKPVPKHCHANVEIWCRQHPSYRPIKGWLVASYDLGLFNFMAHAVVEDDAGNLFDITPILMPCPFPFLRHEESDGEYNELMQSMIFQGETNFPFLLDV